MHSGLELEGHYFERPAVDEAARRATTEFGSELELGEAAVGRYREQGFLLYPGFVKNATVQAFSQTLDAVHDGSTLATHNRRAVEMEPEQPGDCGRVRRVYEPCTRYAAFEAFARSPLLLHSAALARRVRLIIRRQFSYILLHMFLL